MKYRTDAELLYHQKVDVFRIEKAIQKYGDDWQNFLDAIPGFVHMNRKSDIAVHFINKKGIKLTGFTNTELNELGYEYQIEHLDPYTLHVTTPKLVNFIQKNEVNKVFTFGQSFRKREGKKYELILSVTKPMVQQDQLLSYSLPLEKLDTLSLKVKRLLFEQEYIHNHYWKFEKLTTRELHILKLIATGLTNHQISEQLLITQETVKQHRKQIKKKTGCRNIVELLKFAQAFDLV